MLKRAFLNGGMLFCFVVYDIVYNIILNIIFYVDIKVTKI